MRPEAAAWLAKAEEDLADARYLADGGREGAAAFAAQQAAEKALKALLIEREGDFPRVHDLVKLARLLQAPPEVEAAGKRLSPAYVAYRYPDAPADFAPGRGSELLKLAEEVVAWTKQMLS